MRSDDEGSAEPGSNGDDEDDSAARRNPTGHSANLKTEMTTKRTPEYRMKTPSQIDWARMAAFIDGEGCIRIANKPCKQNQTRRRTMLLIAITQVNPRLMNWLKETFSGTVSVRKTPVVNYQWTVQSRHAEWILENCLPFFVVKREQAEIGIAHQRVIFRHMESGTPENLDLRHDLRNRLSLAKSSASVQSDEQGTRLRISKTEAA